MPWAISGPVWAGGALALILFGEHGYPHSGSSPPQGGGPKGLGQVQGAPRCGFGVRPSWAGRARGREALAGSGHPSAGGVWGCLSLHRLQGEPRHRAKPGCAFYPRRKVGKVRAEDVLPPGPAGGKATESAGIFWVTLQVQHPSAPGMAPTGQSRPCCRNRSPSKVLTSRAHLSPPTHHDGMSPPLSPAARGIQHCRCQRGSQRHLWGNKNCDTDNKCTEAGQDPALPFSGPTPTPGGRDSPEVSGVFLQVWVTKKRPKREELS